MTGASRPSAKVLVDTNIVIDYPEISAVRGLGGNIYVPSVVMQELLYMQKSGNGWKYDYVPRAFHYSSIPVNVDRALRIAKPRLLKNPVGSGGRRLLFDRQGPFATHAEMGHAEVSVIANRDGFEALAKQARIHKPDKYRNISRNMRTLHRWKATALPLSQETIIYSHSLIDGFLRNHSPKSDLRNCLNDLLIAAQASNLNWPLITSDELLLQIVDEQLRWRGKEISESMGTPGGPAYIFEPASDELPPAKRRKERYVNSMWWQRNIG